MFELMKQLDGPFLAIRIQNEITGRETRELVELIERRFQEDGPVRLLVVYELDSGVMDAESLYEDMRFAKLASDKLDRMAVIGKESWENTWVSLFGLFGGIRTQYFLPEDFEAALAWLQE